MIIGESTIHESNIRSFINPDTDKYSVWVYGSGDNVMVYDEALPNTVEIWFRFNKFSHLYWKLFEEECVDEVKGFLYYNFTKVKLFMIRRMLSTTNFSDIRIEYGSDGVLSSESYNSIMSIHPRILRGIMNKVDVFPKPMKKSEERELDKQCSTLFGKGQGVQNPHPYITLYCNLAAFWDKFGMNYFDIMKLPQETFRVLKQVLSLENGYRSDAMANATTKAKASSTHSGNAPRHGQSVRF